jgi:hypothetical protein
MWANYKTSKNYYAQSQLFPVIKLKNKKRRNNTNKVKTSLSKSIKYNYFLRFKTRVKITFPCKRPVAKWVFDIYIIYFLFLFVG